METSDLLRYQIIKSVIAQHPEKGAAVNLWEWLASHIIDIVSESGFQSLYKRSIFLTQPRFPWLAAGALLPQTDYRFAELKRSFEATFAQASEANTLLLLNFTGILASIIGEQLTITILRSAWGIEAANGVSKEFINE